MHPSYQKPNFFTILTSDHIAGAGFVLCMLLPFIILPILLLLSLKNVALIATPVILIVASLFVVPRYFFVNRLFETGIPLRGEVLFVEVRVGKNGHSVIRYSYIFENKQYRAVLRTTSTFLNLSEGTAIDVIVDPRNPHRSILPMMYVQSVGQQ